MAETTSPSLLLRIRNHDDQDAWEDFLAIYTPMVRSYCLQRKIQEADIEDIVQEVMSGLASSIREFEYDPNKGRFRSWLGTVAANRINNFMAKSTRRTGGTFDESTDRANQYVDPDSDWVAIFSERIYRVAVSRVRGDFTDQTWHCFERTWLDNMPSVEVAKALGIPVHSVYVNKSRVLKRLEAEVQTLAEDVVIPPAKSNQS